MIEPFVLTGEIEPKVVNNFLTLASSGLITDLVISSPGGDLGLMFGMFDVIRLQGINVHGVGILQSAAAVLLQAGKIRTMTNSSLLMFHEVEEKTADSAFRLYTQLVEMIAQRSGIPIPEAHLLFDGKWINANKAHELNLVDEVVTDAPVDAYDTDKLRWVNDRQSNRHR